ncbi:helix-turn-helix transcriptional regulator [Kitasatospora griseola]|uniref:helix-turn-helix transcriptional regulator n=1 Tax=Kitasatospora griseola TaxID=2064 RepID=UPI003442F727
MTLDPISELSTAQRQLIALVTGGATFAQIAAHPENRLQPDSVRSAIDAVLAITGTRTPAHLAAWATARRLVTEPVRPSGALIVTPALPPRRQQVLCGWAGGKSNEELAHELGITRSTVRGYGKALIADLDVGCARQAVVVGVLSGLVLLRDVDPSWPAKPLVAEAAPVSGARIRRLTDNATRRFPTKAPIPRQL